MTASPIRLYYYRHRSGQSNFGDALSPLIIERVIGRPTVWAHQAACDVAAIGSILGSIVQRRWKRWLHMRFDPVHVWGSGFIRPYRDGPNPLLKCHAVRGHISRLALGLPEDTALGDPGLLAGRLIVPPADKRHGWAIVPHLSDLRLPVVKALHERNPHSVIADLSDDPLDILRTIAASEFVVSTSLHGLVIADALGIPSIWATFSGKVSGDRYKFEDYYSALGIPAPVRLDIQAPLDFGPLEALAQVAPKAAVNHCCQRLTEAFPGL